MQLAMRQNGYTRDEFLHAILHSGQVTKIGQHLALVLYHLADTTTNVARLSLSDLERITGWAKSTILDHLSEIEMFVRTTIGKGRRKTQFELQGIITEAVEDLRRVQEANSKDGVHQPNAKANATPNSTVNSIVRVHEPNPAPNSTHRVQEGNSTDPDRVRVANSAKESFPPHPPSKKTTLSGGEVENTSAHARGTSLVTVNCEAIYGPNFTLSFAAIDQCAALSGISKERARGIAEICAWDWASNGVKPQAPMAMVRKAIQNDRNSEEIHQAQLAKARSGGSTMRTLPR